MTSPPRNILLHMTDLHFGCDGANANLLNSRQLALNGLARTIRGLDPVWKPTIVAVTGDLGWRGKASEYETFGGWFAELLREIGITPDRCFFCPGNHDVDRSIARSIARPRDAKEADEVLGIPLASQYKDAFHAFSAFSEKFGVPPYQIGREASHLIGVRSLGGVSFVAMNSSWFCKGKDDQGNLWLGLPFLKELEAHKQIPSHSDIRQGGPFVALFHHPREWFNASEITTYGTRPNPFVYLAQRCDLMLTGHTHGEVGRADLVAESAWHFRTGATYVDDNYVNTFTLVRIDDQDCTYLSFEYDARSVNHEWRQVSGGARGLPYHRGRPAAFAGTDQGSTIALQAYRARAQHYAAVFAELKSRVLRPQGLLPAILPLGVAPAKRLTNRRTSSQEPEAPVRPVPLFEAVRTARATLLLGDLGTGKSTLAAALVKQTHDLAERALAILVPAKSLVAAVMAIAEVQSDPTVRQFLQAISNFTRDHIAPSVPVQLDIEQALNEKVEVSVFVDGLDEVSALSASLLLRLLLGLTDHWANVQVLATGRPVELSSVPYENWQTFSPVPLQDRERWALFVAEARADGQSDQQALASGTSLLTKLRKMTDVHSLANTPLMVRLLYSHLASILGGDTITAGDLLFEVLKERLGSWETRDAKKAVAAIFPQHYPDSAARIALLGEVALSIYPRQSLSVEEFHHKLQDAMPVTNPGVVASEALTYFVQTGVVVQTGEIEFPLRPLLEFLYGYATALRLDSLPSVDLKYWRPISYAATTVRKLGLGAPAKAAVSGYVRRLVAEAQVFAASFIVAELRDQPGAVEFVKALREFVHKPLSARSAPGIAWTQAARAFADSIRLAGEAGFDWFFDEYLDPRYPFVHVGSMAVLDVFKEWTALSIGDLSDHERQRLAQIPAPHIAGDSDQLHGVVARIAILMPEVFDFGIRVWFCAMNLAEEAFAGRAKDLIQVAANSDPDLVKSVLEQCINTGFANHAAAVYLDLFPAAPPLAVIRGIIRLESGQAEVSFSLDDNSKDRLTSIEASAWRNLLNWYVFDVDSPLAARAAIKLFELGETRLTFIGDALLRGMHDGGYIPRAEETLKLLVQRQGEWALRWLARRIGDAAEEMHGAHSGWWRILLEHLPSLSGDGPRLLAGCVSGLGCFLLARNPEVRQRFVQLLNGSEGANYQTALRAQLTHRSVAVRHGAAMVLLLANPKTEAEALEVVVRAKSARNSGTWHEWERFCLTLRFGASALATLQSHLPEMPEPSAIFGLAILKRNGTALSAEQKERLLIGKD